MATATAPYDGPLGKTIDVDPDDINNIVGDVTKDLTDRVTTAASVVAVLSNVTALQGPTIEGTLIKAQVQMLVPAGATAATVYSITFRITCANGERFDRTIYFKLVSN